jgi:hypothetical protein
MRSLVCDRNHEARSQFEGFVAGESQAGRSVNQAYFRDLPTTVGYPRDACAREQGSAKRPLKRRALVLSELLHSHTLLSQFASKESGPPVVALFGSDKHAGDQFCFFRAFCLTSPSGRRHILGIRVSVAQKYDEIKKTDRVRRLGRFLAEVE